MGRQYGLVASVSAGRMNLTRRMHHFVLQSSADVKLSSRAAGSRRRAESKASSTTTNSTERILFPGLDGVRRPAKRYRVTKGRVFGGTSLALLGSTNKGLPLDVAMTAREAVQETQVMVRTFCTSGENEGVKGGVHGAACLMAGAMALYNAVAWCLRRESHLAVNAVVYTLAVGWEVKQTMHHVQHLRQIQRARAVAISTAAA